MDLYTCDPMAARAGLVPLRHRGRPPWMRRRQRGVGRSHGRDRVRWRAGAAGPVMQRRSPAPVKFENVRSSWPPPESDQRRAWCSCHGLPRGAGRRCSTTTQPGSVVVVHLLMGSRRIFKIVAFLPSVEVWGSKSLDFANTCRGAGPVPVKKGAPGEERAGGRNPSLVRSGRPH